MTQIHTLVDPAEVLSALKQVLPESKRPIPLHEPLFTGNEWRYTKECLDSGWVSSIGSYVDKFERQLADLTGIQKAVAVVNGTSALHIALQLIDIQPNDEVLIPTLSFVAPANAVTYCGAIPHFVDSDENCLRILGKERAEGLFVTRVNNWNEFDRYSGSTAFALLEVDVPKGTARCTQKVNVDMRLKDVQTPSDGDAFILEIGREGIL